MKYIFVFLVLITACTSKKEMTADEVITRSISYHDPNGVWQNFQGTLEILMQTPDRPDRLSYVEINRPEQSFKLTEIKEMDTVIRFVNRDTVYALLNGKIQIEDSIISKHRLKEENARMYRNYYTYLYGLPMKINDPGARITQEVEEVTFKNKAYLKVCVDYDEAVGTDTWFFYFDPETYALETYQFYHNREENDGEYILLEGIEVFEGMRIPKTRKWYYNKNDGYLGTDFLQSVK